MLLEPAGEGQRRGDTVAIMVNDTEQPWGVVIGTSDKPRHFQDSNKAEALSVEPVEAIRILAGLVALALSGNNASAET